MLNIGGESAENLGGPEAVLLNRRFRAADWLIPGVQLYQACGVTKSTRRCSAVSSLEPMVTLLEYIGLATLVVVSLGGFAAAVAWTFAIWFGDRS